MTPVSARLAVVGVGLLGGSLAAALRGRFAEIVGFEPDAASAAFARETGLVDRIGAEITDALDADVCIVAAPVDASHAILATLAEALERGTRAPGLLIDVASIQVPFVPYMARIPTYITTHPMAGSERSGPRAADAALFRARSWLYEPHADAALVEGLERLVRATGAEPLAIPAARHDASVAVLSHLPQAVSVALGSLAGESLAGGAHPAAAGPGLASMLRLARSSPEVWRAVFAGNAAPTAAALRALAARLTAAAEGLDAGNPEPLTSYFAQAQPALRATERFSSPDR